MDVMEFKWLSRGMKIIFEVIGIIVMIQGVLFLVSLFVGEGLPSIFLSVRDYSLQNVIGSLTPVYTNNFVGFITSSVEKFLLAYTFYHVSQFFLYLEKDVTPFSVKVYQKLRKIGCLLILADIGIPLIYSLILPFTTMKPVMIDLVMVSSLTFVGVIILFMAEVIRYGVKLQEFSDDAV